MFSPVYENKVRVWVLTKSNTGSGDELSLSMTGQSAPSVELTGTVFNSDDRFDYNLRSFEFSNLTEGETFTATLLKNGVATERTSTIENGQNIIDDFSFLAGGCARIYDTSRCIDYPESTTHINGDPEMFNHMAEEDSDLMVWLGDAVYLLGLEHAQGNCPDGTLDDWHDKDQAFLRYYWYRQFHDNLLMSMPQLAITDNHDTGSNEFNKNLPGLPATREVFQEWWPNPEYMSTEEGDGLFSSYVYKDVEYFLTDNRSYRESTSQHFGDEQLDWLKEGLLNSTATFKVIINGTPTFRPIGGRNFSVSSQVDELLNFIKDNNINGVLSYCADIHDQRFMVREMDTKYPLYDIMSGNLNSDIGGNGEAGNYSVNYNAGNDILTGVKHAYVRTSVYGDEGDRRLKVEYVGFDGETFFEEIIHEDMLTSQNTDALNLSLSFTNNLDDASQYTHTVAGSDFVYGADREGNANEALVVNANSSFSVPNASSLDFYNEAYSISFWVNPSEFTANGGTILSNGSADAGMSFGISAAGNLTYTNHANGEELESSLNLLANNWSFVTWKYNNVRKKLSLYYNGFLTQTWDNVESPATSVADFTIGNNFEGKQFIGSLDEINVYGRLIPDADILTEADPETNRGGMLSLDGSQQTMIDGTVTNAALANDFTIEFWAKLNADPGTNNKIFSSNGRVNNLSTGISFEFPSSNKLNVVVGNNGSGWDAISEQGEAWNVGEWNHVAVTATVGGMLQYYVNGEFVAEMNYGGYVPNDYGLGFGYSPYYGGSVQAEMDDIRIWERALTAEEITESMHYILQGDEEDLAIYYDFTSEEEEVTSLVSLGSVNYELDITSAALVTATSPIGNIPVEYRDAVSGKWSQNNDVTLYGLSLPGNITAYNSNIVVGKQENAAIAEATSLEDVFYLQGGWKVDPLNSPLANVSINLNEALGENAAEVINAANRYYLITANEEGTEFSIVSEGNFDGANVNFFNATLIESVYYLAWEEGDFTPGRGGAMALANDHDIHVHYTSPEIIFNGAHTIEMWVNLPSLDTSNGKTIISNHGRINNNTTGMTVELNGNGTLSAVYGTGTPNWVKVTTAEPLEVGEWNHIAITAVAGGELKIYLNGELSQSNSFDAYTSNNTWDFAFGTSINYGGEYIYTMDEFRMWSEERTQEEIVASMHNMLDTDDENLKFYYTFDQEDTGMLVNNGVNTDEVAYTNASVIGSTSPVADMDEDYESSVTASWSYTNEETNGMYVADAISSYAQNIVFGRNNDNTILELEGTEEETHYAAGGWQLNTLNIEEANIAVKLSEVFENVEMVNATVADYLLIKGDPQDAYETVATGLEEDGVVTFEVSALTQGVYYLAYEIDEEAAIAAQGGVIDLPGSHEVYIPKEGVNQALSGEFTIELWGKLNAPAGSNTKLWGFSHYGGGEYGIEMEFLSNQTLETTRGAGSGWQHLNSDHVWNVGEWNHVAVTFVPNGSYKFYVNGELVDSMENAGTFQENTYDLALGKNIFNNAPTNSSIDEFRIWTKAKTQEEIKADMYRTITAEDENLAYNYTFNQEDSGYLVNSGTETVEVAYANASIAPATTPVRIAEAPFDAKVTGNWSVMNDKTNGLHFGNVITDYDRNVVIAREEGNEVLPTIDNETSSQYYLSGRWVIYPLFINSGSLKVDLLEIFENLNQVELIANDYFLLKGDPSTAVEVFATGTKEGTIVTFNNVTFDDEPVYLAWTNIDEYPMGTFPIASGGLWKYNDTGVDLGTDWKNTDYDDSEWAFGNAILGYGDGIESTTLDYGTDADNKYPTYYLRHTFNVEDASQIGSLVFNTMKDDGVVVYVNGVEAFRDNMPEGEITYNTYATNAIGGADEEAWTEVMIENLLQNGENVIAVELHQGSAGSSDLRFDMEVNYTLPALEVTDYPVAKDEEWYFLDNGSDQGTEWTATEFDVIPWSRGNAPFGYGDVVNTEISYGPDSNNKYITSYFVKDINVTLSELTSEVEFGLRRDDGAVVYVNGVEVFRQNMPEGVVDYETSAINAIGGIDENIYHIAQVPSSAFVDGVNRIAVELHQAGGTSSDTRFDMYIKNVEDLAIDCEEEHVGCFTSIDPTSQTTNLIIAEEHDFQMLFKEGDAYITGGGTVAGNNDFTAYVPINGSSEEGYLSVNHENTPGGVSIVDIHLNTENQLWEVDDSQLVDMYNDALVTTTRNCSGGITPWGTIVTAEETMNTGDVNNDGYQDVGWLVEIDPVTAEVVDYDGDSQPDKLWAMGRMNHENVVISQDGTTAYYGEDGGTHCMYKYVMDTPGDLSEGTVYVLKLELPLSGNDPSSSTGEWIVVPNDTQEDRNNLSTVASNVGGTSFNGVEDVEISPIDGKVYFAAKGLDRVYRFVDEGNTFREFETFVGGMSYSVTTASGEQTEPWSNGNDNLTFDDKGNLWVLQDGGNNYIWVVRPDHTQSTPNVELFASMPIGSEPTGLTFTPDYKYGFFSVQHPSSSNTPQEDATGEEVTFNASASIVFALENNIGEVPAGIANPDVTEAGIMVYPNPADSELNIQFNSNLTGEKVTVTVYDILGHELTNVTNAIEGGLQTVKLNVSAFASQNQVLVLNVKVGETVHHFKVLTK
ncbi:hypothetical protein GCM10007424_07140 [Flavobacterium suaedae]|uniref:LamG-like jellyroll fold domain-containing protein n=2 Tax=Flavobacterium suaedae TaxID=1767027 RepID=A0ABQ1JM70_9FLAO|nr:hypothetical protein GCM10007424_07140 [Flavobacterium suaedae]